MAAASGAFLMTLTGNAFCLVIGAAWLAVLIGPAKAIAVGVRPFILGGILKSALAVARLRAFALRW